MIIMIVVLSMPFGVHGTQQASAVAPDVYQVTAGSSVVDTDAFQTGVISPSPFFKTAFPLTSVTSNNEPLSEAHAAFLEPPTVAQAASNLNNIAIPYPTQAEALCANCSTPLSQDADGNVDQHINGTRITLGAGHAHAESTKLTALGEASNGVQTVGALDQLTGLYTQAVSSFYANVVNHPGSTPPPKPISEKPGCQQAPQSALTPDKQVCPAAPPAVSVVAQTGGSSSHSQVITDDNGTIVDTLSNLTATRLFNGLIYISSIATEVRAAGDGTAKGSTVSATNAIQGVCVNNDCNFSITAAGICKTGAVDCGNDPVNMGLRQQGFNLCKLSAQTARAGNSVVGDASGLLLEWHVKNDGKGNQAPDPEYYKSFGNSACENGIATPHEEFAGTSFYLKLGRSEAQLTTRSFPTFGGSFPSNDNSTAGAGTTATGTGTTGSTGTGGSSTLGGGTPVLGPTTGGAHPPVPLGSVSAVASLDGVKDRRPLLLSVFGLLEVILLCNLTAMALARRG
ncbi:MAG TPA: hypothetical protein VH134_02520 [Candidatus Dormibacteraeota bacterium]|nr:hypothetical protein [Candidatus Dormibacteraeota bacterium]